MIIKGFIALCEHIVLCRQSDEMLETRMAQLEVRRHRCTEMRNFFIGHSQLDRFEEEIEAELLRLKTEKTRRRKGSHRVLSPPNSRDDLKRLPTLCRAAISFFMKAEQREVLFGDLEADYQDFKVEFGVKYANTWLTKETIRNLWPYVGAWFKKTGLIAFFINVVHRLLS